MEMIAPMVYKLVEAASPKDYGEVGWVNMSNIVMDYFEGMPMVFYVVFGTLSVWCRLLT